jgi:ankyrin repeat protein
MIAIATRKSLQALEELEKQYKADSSKVSHQHIGICIKEIAGRVDWEHRNVLAIRYLVHSIMEFVFDLMEDTAKLNDFDDNNMTPLLVAIKEYMLDCAAALLARGASTENLPECSNTEFEAIFDLHKLLEYQKRSNNRLLGIEIMSATSWREKKSRHKNLALNNQLSALHWAAAEPLSDGEIVRLHVPFISVRSHAIPY